MPALRRVRAVSPANRSDGFLGSDMSQDDGPFFDGKPEDFTWTLKGEADQLRIVDPLSLQGKSNSIWMPGGGWRANWDEELKIIGYQDPELEGARLGAAQRRARQAPLLDRRGRAEGQATTSTARSSSTSTRRPIQGAWNRKFSWQGELLNTLQIMAYNLQPYTRPDGTVDYIQGSNMSYNVAENIKANRATVAGSEVGSEGGARHARHVRAELLRHELAVAVREVRSTRREDRNGRGHDRDRPVSSASFGCHPRAFQPDPSITPTTARRRLRR